MVLLKEQCEAGRCQTVLLIQHVFTHNFGQKMAQIIINADDFGLSPGVNMAVCRLFEEGILSSTSALVCARYVEEGIETLPTKYHGSVGLHVCLDEEGPVSDPNRVSTLIDHKSGLFKKRWIFIRDLLLHKISAHDIYTEIKAQFERLHKLGIKPSHVDSHGHVHVLPQVSRVVAKLSKEYNILRIRKPAELYWRIFRPTNLRRLPISWAITKVSNHTFKKHYHNHITPAIFLGLLDSGRIDNAAIEKWVAVLKKYRGQTIEIMCHPGIEDNDRELLNYKHWKYRWQVEFNSLFSLKDIMSC